MRDRQTHTTDINRERERERERERRREKKREIGRGGERN